MLVAQVLVLEACNAFHNSLRLRRYLVSSSLGQKNSKSSSRAQLKLLRRKSLNGLQ